ncbi:GNAT family N-acetyltransferase [Methylibium rhizosphaerae]|uniref:GNAT family N-acetyltransferase n=1 Tax=Methylibium rhizosphaerae TaxID=2570323 RepID=UPI00112B8B86|nr:GNAT family N-acetyltransferase [Methylibium rhizosphaerae]
MKVLETPRLTLRRLAEGDDAFILELLNEPGWLRYIGDKGVRCLDDARRYISQGPMAMYERVGFGLWLVQRTADGVPLGICGLIRRDGLDDVDIGFAFLARYGSMGYAHEAASACMAHAREVLRLPRVVAITVAGNQASIRLLEKLGLRFEREINLPHSGEPLRLYAGGGPGS